MADEVGAQKHMMTRRTTQALIEQPDEMTVDRTARGEETPVTAPATHNLRAPELHLNRELTWLEFNRRVLHEAQDSRNPLLERVKFLAIVHANFDEFFMKRIGGLKQQIGAGVQSLSVDGRSPMQQI